MKKCPPGVICLENITILFLLLSFLVLFFRVYIFFFKQNNHQPNQNNKEKIIILTLQSGGQSISLHDKTGHHPRVSIILPSFSSIDLIQALGRIHRSGVKSYCYQNIIFCANTHEENICNKIKNKIKFMKDINEFNDNDFGLDDIKF